MIAETPIFLSIIFLFAIIIPIVMIANVASRNAPKEWVRQLYWGIIGFYSFFLIGTAVACLNGAFVEYSLPPKIIQVTAIPLLIFLLGFIFHTSLFKTILKRADVADLIRLHIFRLIGGFFIALYLLGHLPQTFALMSGLGDIITALTSLWVARAITRNKPYANRLALIWNTFGLVDILVTAVSAVLLTQQTMKTGQLGVDILTTFPYCFIPAFAPATIIFLHITIYRKLLIKKYQ